MFHGCFATVKRCSALLRTGHFLCDPTLFFSFLLLPSWLCSPGLSRRTETHCHGGHEGPGHAIGRRHRRSEGSPAQDGDPNDRGAEPRRQAPQAQTSRHEHPDAVRLLERSRGVPPHRFHVSVGYCFVKINVADTEEVCSKTVEHSIIPEPLKHFVLTSKLGLRLHYYSHTFWQQQHCSCTHT